MSSPVSRVTNIPVDLHQKSKVLAFNTRMMLEQIYPRDVWPGAPDYENGDSGSVLVKQAWLALEAFEKELGAHNATNRQNHQGDKTPPARGI